MDQSANEGGPSEFQPPAIPTSASGDKWGILLIDANHSPFLFVRALAQGVQGAAQLCWSLNDQRYVVRKRALNAISSGRMERPDRECKIAREIQERQAQLPSGAPATRYEFANLISNGDLHVNGEHIRESYWTFYNGGGNLYDFLGFINGQPYRPHALVLNLMHSVLEALQWLNSMELMHLDAHPGNVFLRWEGHELVPVIVRTILYSPFSADICFPSKQLT